MIIDNIKERFGSQNTPESAVRTVDGTSTEPQKTLLPNTNVSGSPVTPLSNNTQTETQTTGFKSKLGNLLSNVKDRIDTRIANAPTATGGMYKSIYQNLANGKADVAQNSYASFKQMQMDRNSQYYQGYAVTPSNSVYLEQLDSILGELGLATQHRYSGITQKDIDTYGKYADWSNQTGSLSQSSSTKATPEQRLAYILQQLNNDEANTQKVEEELNKMASAVQWYHNKGYDDKGVYNQIMNDMAKEYPTLAKAWDASRTTGATLSAFNRPLNWYGEDTIYGMIYAAQNGKSYDGETDIMGYYGIGSTTTADASDAAKHQYNNPDTFHPYYNGASDNTKINTLCKKYGITKITPEWVEEHQDELLSDKAKNDSGTSDWDICQTAIENYNAANAELPRLKSTCEEMFANGASWEDVISYVSSEMNKKDTQYPTLAKMEQKRATGGALELADTVDFALPYFIEAKEGNWLYDTAVKAYEQRVADEEAQVKATFGDGAFGEQNVGRIAYFYAKENKLLDEEGNLKEGAELTYADIIKYANENKLVIDPKVKNGVIAARQLNAKLNAFSSELDTKIRREEQAAKKEAASKVTIDENFTLSGMNDWLKALNGKEKVDAEQGYTDGWKDHLNGNYVTDAHAASAIAKYGDLVGGARSRYVIGGSAESDVTIEQYDERMDAYGETAAKLLAEVDDAARDGYITQDEQIEYINNVIGQIERFESKEEFKAAVDSGDPEALAVLSSMQNTIATNKETIDAEARKAREDGVRADWQLINDTDPDSWDVWKKAAYENIINTDISSVMDEGYNDARSKLEDYSNEQLFEQDNSEDPLLRELQTDGDYYLSRYNSAVRSQALRSIEMIEKIAYSEGVSFNDACKAMGIESIDDIVKEAVETTMTSYQNTYNMVMSTVEGLIDKNGFVLSSLSARDKNALAVNESVDIANADTRARALNALVKSGAITEDVRDELEAAYANGDEETVGRINSLLNNALNKGKVSDPEVTDFATSFVEDIYHDAIDANDEFVRGVDGSVTIVAKGDDGSVKGWFTATGLGVDKGLVIHANGWVDVAYAMFGAKTPDEMEMILRNTFNGNRQLAKEGIESRIMEIKNDTLRQYYLDQLNNYQGDIFNFKFNRNAAMIKSVQQDLQEKATALDNEAGELLGADQLAYYNNMANAVNSLAVSAETILVTKGLSGLMGGSTALANLTNMQRLGLEFAGNMATTGMLEGAPVFISTLERTGDRGEAFLRATGAGTVNAALEAGFDEVLNIGLENAFNLTTGIDNYVENIAFAAGKFASKGLQEGSIPHLLVSNGVKGLINFAGKAGISQVSESLQEGGQSLATQFFENVGVDNGEQWIDWDEVLGSAKAASGTSGLLNFIVGGGGVKMMNAATSYIGANVQSIANGNGIVAPKTVTAISGLKDANRVSNEINKSNETVARKVEENNQILNEENAADENILLKTEDTGNALSTVADAVDADQSFDGYELIQSYADAAQVEYQVLEETAKAAQEISKSELGQAKVEAEVRVADLTTQVEEQQYKYDEAVSDMDTAEQELRAAQSSEDIENTTKRYQASVDVVNNIRDNLNVLTTALGEARVEAQNAAMAVKSAVTDIYRSAAEKAPEILQSMRDARIAAREEIFARANEAFKQSEQAKQEQMLIDLGNKYDNDFLIKRAMMKSQQFASKVLNNYTETVAEAKTKLVQMFEQSFRGWTINIDNNAVGSGSFDPDNHVITLNGNMSIQEMFAYVNMHELGHLAKKLKNVDASGKSAWDVLQNSILNTVWGGAKTKEFIKEISRIKKLYAQNGIVLNTSEAMEEAIVDGGAKIFAGLDSNELSLFSRYVTRNGGYKFGNSIYKFLKQQAKYIKKYNSESGFFKNSLSEQQKNYVNIINAFADAIKEAIETNNKLFMEKYSNASVETQETVSVDETAQVTNDTAFTESTATETPVASENDATANEEPVTNENPLTVNETDLLGNLDDDSDLKALDPEYQKTLTTERTDKGLIVAENVDNSDLESLTSLSDKNQIYINGKLATTKDLSGTKAAQNARDIDLTKVARLTETLEDGSIKHTLYDADGDEIGTMTILPNGKKKFNRLSHFNGNELQSLFYSYDRANGKTQAAINGQTVPASTPEAEAAQIVNALANGDDVNLNASLYPAVSYSSSSDEFGFAEPGIFADNGYNSTSDEFGAVEEASTPEAQAVVNAALAQGLGAEYEAARHTEDIKRNGLESTLERAVDENERRNNPEGTIKDSEGNDTIEIIDGSAVKYSEFTWSQTDKNKLRDELIKRGFAETDVDKWINDVNSVAALIASDRERLDYESDEDEVFMKPNNDYVITLDASTLCDKRRLYQGTFNAIQHALKDTVLTSDDLLDLTNLLGEMKEIAPCAICYVESRRRHLGRYAQEWLDSYDGEYKPHIDELTTTDGLYNLKKTHPEAAEAFLKAMNSKGTANPKVVQLRTAYDGDINHLTPGKIKKIIDIGGVRIQSFSDFEIVHLIDMMQAVLDMTKRGLTSQAYTKVANFADVFGGTGIKINLSLIASGVDANGQLILSPTEGMDIDTALRLREKYSKNVGTIVVVGNDEQFKAAMVDPRIDFIIPFHRSGWGNAEIAKLDALAGYGDYQSYQNERYITPVYDKKGNPLKPKQFTPNGPNGYWDFDKTGDENAAIYLMMCEEDGRIPKFDNMLTKDADGHWVAPEGYWKTLIDFKMYDNDGVGAPQTAVQPIFDMEAAQRVLAEYEGGANELPVSRKVVDEYLKRYKEKYPNTKFSLFYNPGDNSLSSLIESMDFILQDALKKGNHQDAARITGELFALMNRKKRSQVSSATPTDALRDLTRKLGSNLYEGVSINKNYDSAQFDKRSKALFTNNLTAQNYAGNMRNVARLVAEHLSQDGVSVDTITDSGVDFNNFFFDYMISTDAKLKGISGYASTLVRFNDALSKDTALKTYVENARQQISGYFTATATEKAAVQLRSISQARKERSSKSGFRKFIQDNLDDMEAARIVDDMYSAIMGIKNSGELHRTALYTHYSGQVANQWWKGDTRVDYNGDRLDGLTLSQLSDKHGINHKRDYDTINRYLMSREALDRYQNGKAPFNTEGNVTNDSDSKVAMTEEDCRRAVQEIEYNSPNVAAFCNDVYKWWDDFMQNVAVAGGVLTQEAYDTMKAQHPHYAPLKRVMDDAYGQYRNSTAYQLHAAKGMSNRDVINPMEEMSMMMNQFSQMAATNQIVKKFDEMYTRAGGMGTLAERFTDADLAANGGILNSIPSNAIVLNNEDGSHTYYVVKDAGLGSMLSGSIGNPISSSKIMSIIGKSTRAMSALTTGVNMIFAGKNALRDFQHSVNYGSWATTYFDGALKWIKAAYDVSRQELLGKGSETVKDFIAMGGGGWQRVDLGANKSVEQWKNDSFGFATKKAKWGHTVLNLITAESLNSIIESTSRYAEYAYGKHDLSTTEGRQEAYMAAMEATVDFRRHGNGYFATLMKTMTPFYNATLQGQYQDLRLFTEDYDGRRGIKIGKMIVNNAITGALSAASFMFANELKALFGVPDDDDDEDFKQLYLDMTDTMKQSYILIPGFWMNGARDCFRIPLTQGSLSQVAYEFGRKSIESIFTGDSEDLVRTGFGADLVNLAWHSTLGNLLEMTSIFSPFLNVAMNKNYYGSNIISSTEEGRYYTNQYDSGTPSAFIYAANMMDGVFNMLGLDDDNFLRQAFSSPKMGQYIAQQYTGILGQLAIPFMSTDRYTGEWHPVGSILNTFRNAWTLDMNSATDIDDLYAYYSKKVDRLASSNGFGYGEVDGRFSEEEASQKFTQAKMMNSKGGIFYDTDQENKGIYAERVRIMSNTALSQTEREEQAEQLQQQAVENKKKAIREASPFIEDTFGGNLFTQLAATIGGKTIRAMDKTDETFYKMDNAYQTGIKSEVLDMSKKMYEQYASEHGGSYSSTMLPPQPVSFTSEGKKYNVKPELEDEMYDIGIKAYNEAATELIAETKYSTLTTKDWAKVYQYAYNAQKEWYLSQDGVLDNID